MIFSNHSESHEHSLKTLELLELHGDFMESIDSVLDMGCGKGLDLQWWATRTVLDDDDNEIPLNINCYGLDIDNTFDLDKKYDNITFMQGDFENFTIDKKFDVIWCHNSFQYSLNPMETLKSWRELLNDNGMLVLIVPSTTNVEYNRQSFYQYSYQYYDFTIVGMIHWLAINGYEVSLVHLDRLNKNSWLKIVAYKSAKVQPLDPRKTSWYDLCDKGLLPSSVVKSVNRYGYPKQQDLVLEWLDHNLTLY